jgi:hypothetical protein
MEILKSNDPPKIDEEQQSQQIPDDEDEVDYFQATQQLTDENDENDLDTPNNKQVDKILKDVLSIHNIDIEHLTDFAKWTNRTWNDDNIKTIQDCLQKNGLQEIDLKRYMRQYLPHLNIE